MRSLDIFENLNEIKHFSRYLEKYEKISLTQLLSQIIEAEKNDPDKITIDIILEQTLQFVIDTGASTISDIQNHYIDIPPLKESIRQHLIISSLYTCRELSSKKIDAKEYLLNISSEKNRSSADLSEENIYRFLLNSLGRFEKNILNISTTTINGGSKREISDFLPLFLYGYRDNRCLRNLKFTKPDNSERKHNSRRRFRKFLDNLDTASYKLIDYNDCDSVAEQILYYYKCERIYGVDLLKEILLQMNFETGELLAALSLELHRRNRGEMGKALIESLDLYDWLKEKTFKDIDITTDDIYSFLPDSKQQNTNKKFKNISLSEKEFYLSPPNDIDKWNNYYKDTVFDIEFINKLQQLPNVFSRNELVSILNREDPLYLDDLLYRIIPLAEFTFFSLIVTIQNPMSFS